MKVILSILVLLPYAALSFTATLLPSRLALQSTGRSSIPNPGRTVIIRENTQFRRGTVKLNAQISEQEAKKAIDRVVAALRKDKEALSELGKLEKVTTVLGYGSPRNGVDAVRFNASFKKGGFGRAAVPLPFGLGQTNVSEGRGQMVGQVKASLDKNGKILDCSVFRDLGYGRAFNLKI